MKRFLSVLAAIVLASLTSAAGPWQTREGYRGFVDVGGIAGVGDYGMNAVTISTTHGYQVIPSYLYLGAGIGLDGHDGACFLPLFADIRSQLPTGRFSPFVDMRLGYGGRLGDWGFDRGGFYFNPSIGVTWTLSRRVGLELSVGYTLQDAVVWEVYYDDFMLGSMRKDIGGISFRFGVTF